MNNWKSLLGVGLIFALGMVTGGFVTAVFTKRAVDHVVDGGTNAARGMIVARLGRQLSLTVEQKERLVAIVTRAQDEIRVARREIQPRIDRTLDQSEGEIRAILTPEQTPRFDRLVQEGRRKLKGFDP
jgi:Spy/CpxP family protein refolding chaperone